MIGNALDSLQKISSAKKILFITHTTSIYGAARSLEILLRNLEGDHHLLIPRSSLKQDSDLQKISERFNIPENRIHVRSLPFRVCFIAEKAPWRRRLKRSWQNWRWRKTEIENFSVWLKEENFSTVHLNSLALIDLVATKPDFILHVRERWTSRNSAMEGQIKKAKALVFIDSSTKESLAHLSGPKTITLSNPVEISLPAESEILRMRNELLKEPASKLILFSMIGRLDFPNKGVDFVLEQFKKLENPQARLLIFGKGTPENFSDAKQIAGKDSRIRFLGELADQNKIYACSDVILRGENSFAVGRTVLEGLAAGCRVIMPKKSSPLSEEDVPPAHLPQLDFYQARDADSFLNTLRKNASFQRMSPNPVKTGQEYAQNFLDFVNDSL